MSDKSVYYTFANLLMASDLHGGLLVSSHLLPEQKKEIGSVMTYVVPTDPEATYLSNPFYKYQINYWLRITTEFPYLGGERGSQGLNTSGIPIFKCTLNFIPNVLPSFKV